MQEVTSAVFHGLLLSHYGMKVLCCHGGPLSLKDMPCPHQPPSPPFHPETRLYLWASCTAPNLYAWVLQRGLTAIFVPPTSTTWEQEARNIPAVTGHWTVGEFGSSSPDWWMACPTLSEQDRRCAGCGPQIVTFDCFIRAWLIGPSSPWNEGPRHLLPVLQSSRDRGLRTAWPNQGPMRQQAGLIDPALNSRKPPWNDAPSRCGQFLSLGFSLNRPCLSVLWNHSAVPSLFWLWWTVGEPEERPSEPGPLVHCDVYFQATVRRGSDSVFLLGTNIV